jgi:hypothetical protein
MPDDPKANFPPRCASAPDVENDLVDPPRFCRFSRWQQSLFKSAKTPLQHTH